jgi:hypothetical protein
MVGKLGYVSFLTFITISALAPAAAGESDHVTTITIEGPSRPKPSAQAACTEITTAPQLNRIRTDLAGDLLPGCEPLAGRRLPPRCAKRNAQVDDCASAARTYLCVAFLGRADGAGCSQTWRFAGRPGSV